MAILFLSAFDSRGANCLLHSQFLNTEKSILLLGATHQLQFMLDLRMSVRETDRTTQLPCSVVLLAVMHDEDPAYALHELSMQVAS
jgi:hypothetical protein